jgi:hypothetical protein
LKTKGQVEAGVVLGSICLHHEQEEIVAQLYIPSRRPRRRTKSFAVELGPSTCVLSLQGKGAKPRQQQKGKEKGERKKGRRFFHFPVGKNHRAGAPHITPQRKKENGKEKEGKKADVFSNSTCAHILNPAQTRPIPDPCTCRFNPTLVAGSCPDSGEEPSCGGCKIVGVRPLERRNDDEDQFSVSLLLDPVLPLPTFSPLRKLGG